MEIYCTRLGCPRPQNFFADLDNTATLKTVQQKYCTSCGMPLILGGRYLPLKLLGQGGFGAAFLARDRYTPKMRLCVVKQFKPAGELSATDLEIAQKLFEREAEVLEDIGNQHPQIPDLFAFFELTVPGLQRSQQDSFFYLAQEFIDGKNLEEELAQKGKFSEAEVMDVLRAILPVLKFVHENGSIHRDIKPSNIMRDRNGKLYLLDFGAVKQVTKAAVSASKNSTGIYSVGFAPPEQMAGKEVYPSTDLYALAVTVVMLLTGKEATQLFDAYKNQLNWRTQANVSDALADVLDRMLISAPNKRFQSTQEVIAALNPAKTPTPAPPTPVTPPQVPSTSAPPVSTQPPSRPAFSTLEILAGAAFSGFEGGLIAIAIYNVLQSTQITLGVSALILTVLIFAQSRRWLEKWDLLIVAGLTSALVLFIPALHSSIDRQAVAFLAVAAGLIAIALTALFRLIYHLLARIF